MLIIRKIVKFFNFNVQKRTKIEKYINFLLVIIKRFSKLSEPQMGQSCIFNLLYLMENSHGIGRNSAHIFYF